MARAPRFVWLHPAIFGAAVVLQHFAASNVSPNELMRPLLVVTVVAIVGIGFLKLMTRNAEVAAVIMTVLLAVTARYVLFAGLLMCITAWWLIVSRLRLRRNHSALPRYPTLAAASFATLLLIVGASGSLLSAKPFKGPTALPAPTSAGGPNIYILLLDGYPRQDTLATDYGFDNSSLVDQFEEMGLIVADRARSNYNKTWLSVGSLLSGTYVHTLPGLSPPPQDAARQVRLLHAAINQSPIVDYLQERGYRIISIPSSIVSAGILEHADVRIPGHLTAFEIQLLRDSILSRVAPVELVRYIVGDQRANIDDQLTIFARAAEDRSATPQFTFAHIMSPHPPFILGQSADYLEACFPRCDYWSTPLDATGMTRLAYDDALTTQVDSLNEKVVAAVRRVISADPAAVILVLSDHGSRSVVDETTEHFRSLFAARVPGHPHVFPRDVSTVNVFRILIRSIFDQDVGAVLPYEAWASEWFHPLDLRRMP